MNLRPGLYEVRIQAEGFVPYRGRMIQIRAGETVEETFELAVGATVLGRVVDEKTGNPLPGVSVRLYPSQGGSFLASNVPSVASAITNSSGHFALEDAPAGLHRMNLEPEAPYAWSGKEITVPQNDVLDAGDLSLGEGRRLTGRLIKVPGDEGVPNAAIEAAAISQIGHPTFQGSTDPQGHFEITGLPAGNLRIRAPQYGAELMSSSPVGTPAPVTLQIGTARLHGRVTRSGQPAKARIIAAPTDGRLLQMMKAESDTSGTYELQHLPPGSWTIVAYQGAPSAGQEITLHVEAGAVLEKNFELPER